MGNSVSIIMPAYNSSSYISDSIDSVLSQTYADWELIIIDDCSTDDTALLAGKYTDERIILLKNDVNVGGAESRNIGISRANGRYIAFLDSDDMWSHDKLEIQIEFMRAHNYGFTYTAYTTVGEDGVIGSAISVPSIVRLKDIYKHNWIGCLTAIYDTLPFGKVYMPNVRKRQDFALWIKLLELFECAYGVRSNLGYYRIREGSLSENKFDALKFYWIVLRSVAGLSIIYSLYNILCYLGIVLLKKKSSSIYNRIFT